MYIASDIERKKLGANVRNARRATKHSQEKLAEKVGVGRERISRIERGAHTPDPFLLRKTAKACSVSLDSLFADLDD